MVGPHRASIVYNCPRLTEYMVVNPVLPKGNSNHKKKNDMKKYWLEERSRNGKIFHASLQWILCSNGDYEKNISQMIKWADEAADDDEWDQNFCDAVNEMDETLHLIPIDCDYSFAGELMDAIIEFNDFLNNNNLSDSSIKWFHEYETEGNFSTQWGEWKLNGKIDIVSKDQEGKIVAIIELKSQTSQLVSGRKEWKRQVLMYRDMIGEEDAIPYIFWMNGNKKISDVEKEIVFVEVEKEGYHWPSHPDQNNCNRCRIFQCEYNQG